jgi:hypothetical protein
VGTLRGLEQRSGAARDDDQISVGLKSALEPAAGARRPRIIRNQRGIARIVDSSTIPQPNRRQPWQGAKPAETITTRRFK